MKPVKNYHFGRMETILRFKPDCLDFMLLNKKHKNYLPYCIFEKMNEKMKTVFLSFSIACVMLSCSSKKAATKPDVSTSASTQNKPLEGTYWVLSELNGTAVAATKSGEKPSYIYFDATTKRVSVSGGCNVMGGSYELTEGNRIKFSQMMSTMMACPDMSIEDGLKKMTEGVDNYAVEGDNLMFAKARMAPAARFKAMPAPKGFKLN
jgi:heat shock protein HslJ